MLHAKREFGSLINLNVGGKRFSTSKETLTWIEDSFFSSLLSGRISSYKDEEGAIFIDRDPKVFRCILNFLRSKEVDIQDVDIKSLKREAEFYGIHPLVSRLTVCEELERSSCGNMLFHGMLQQPLLPRPPGVENKSVPQYGAVATDAHTAMMHSKDTGRKAVGAENTVILITGHNSWIAVAYTHCVLCYKVKESCGWQKVFVSPYLPQRVRRVAVNAKVQGMAPDSKTKMVAVAFASSISLWSFQDESTYTEIGTFDMSARIDALFFIGSQLVSTGRRNNGSGGRVGVWNAVSQHWQTQDVVSITSYDSAGSFLLLGCVNGSIYYIDMQKFPLRLKDNDLLITELYRDHSLAAITALSVYLTPKNSTAVGNWIEAAYGTATGSVCVIVQHPELVGQGFQLFQTFTVHRSPVCKVMLSEKHLVSVCSDNNHVRTWTVTRFRGMISTQPGSTPLASFKILALDSLPGSGNNAAGNNIGPHGEREEAQIFVQKLFPLSDQLYIRASSNGDRIAEVKSVDGSAISCFCLHECEGSSRMGSRPRRYLFTGHSTGTIQIWDMTTALDMSYPSKDKKKVLGGPTQLELLSLLGQCDLQVDAQNLPLFSSDCSPNEAAQLLHGLMLRSSNQSLASVDASEGASSTSTEPSERSDLAYEQPGFSGNYRTSSKSCSDALTSHSMTSLRHKRGLSESSTPSFHEQSQSRSRHHHSVSVDSNSLPSTSNPRGDPCPVAGSSRSELPQSSSKGNSTSV